MASSSTLTNALFTAPLLDAQGSPVTDETGQVVNSNEFNRSGLNHFGGEYLCEAAYSGEQARVGDGVIDTFDIAALLWYHFKTPPYDDLSDRPSTVTTTERRPRTRERCGDGMTRSAWKNETANYYCTAASPSGRRLQVATDPEATDGSQAMESLTDEQVDLLEWARVPDYGTWYRIHFDMVDSELPLATDLLLDSLFVEGSISLNNDQAPDFNCTLGEPNCVPEDPMRPWVLYKRDAEYSGDLTAAFQCANILAALTPSEALNGNTLGLRQQSIKSACDYYTFIWVPAQFRSLAAVRQKPAICSTDSQGVPTGAGGFGLQPGSMILTGRKSRNLATTKCARSMESYYVSPNPSPPPRPKPPPPPSPPAIPVPPGAPGSGDGESIGIVIGGIVGGALVLGATAGFLTFCSCCCGSGGARKKGGYDDNARVPLVEPKTSRQHLTKKADEASNAPQEQLSFSLRAAFGNA